MYIIPAIDIIDGKCVRLTQGDYQQKKVYAENPVEIAQQFEAAGIKRLHVVDLDGAKAKRIINYKVLEKIAKATNLQIDFGGGIKSIEDVKIAFNSGAHQITVGTIAAKQPQLFLEWLVKYGNEKIILGADVQAENIATNGWLETSDWNIFSFLKEYINKGIKYSICTDISKDGLLEGSAITLYKKIIKLFPELKLIASGGISNIAELAELKALGCYGAIVGKAIYEGKIKLEDLKNYK